MIMGRSLAPPKHQTVRSKMAAEKEQKQPSPPPQGMAKGILREMGGAKRSNCLAGFVCRF